MVLTQIADLEVPRLPTAFSRLLLPLQLVNLFVGTVKNPERIRKKEEQVVANQTRNTSNRDVGRLNSQSSFVVSSWKQLFTR